jgi:hypothetical protein
VDPEGFRLFRQVFSRKAEAAGGRYRIMDESTGHVHELVIPPDLPDEAWTRLSTLNPQQFPPGVVSYDRSTGAWRWVERLDAPGSERSKG